MNAIVLIALKLPYTFVVATQEQALPDEEQTLQAGPLDYGTAETDHGRN